MLVIVVPELLSPAVLSLHSISVSLADLESSRADWLLLMAVMVTFCLVRVPFDCEDLPVGVYCVVVVTPPGAPDWPD